ncbi:MAG: beta-lactamase family protein [Actinobacteria bacterium]|nr:beta-lactamase family protein [Actinomycetota bacterium]
MSDPTSAPISGYCDPKFAGVREAFAENFAERDEVGAGVCVVVDGHTVVDLVGGWADEARTRLWAPDTIVNFYSAGKAVVALLALQAVDRGLVDLDDPLVSIWPEFAAGGKEACTVRHALSHQAGVPAIRERLTNDDLWNWTRMAGAVAATEPWFEPGSRIVYHTNTYGHLVGEIVRRTTGFLPGDRLREVVAPLHADVQWGVPLHDQHRCAEVIWVSPPVDGIDLDTLEPEQYMVFGGYFNPPGYSSHGVVNTPEWRAAQVPSTNGHGSATGLARLYAAMVEPGRLLSPDLLAEATRVQASGPCPVLGEDIAVGLGFVPTSERRPLGTNPRSFGHFGTGGALGFGDPDAQLGFGYVMNHVRPRWQSTRNRALIDALYSVL